MAQPDFYELAAWLHEHDFASKLSGWLITNDRDNICRIARLDDPSSMVGQPGWPEGFTEPTFASDAEAIEHVRSQAAAGSEWHAAAIAIHDARIPLSLWFPEPDTRPKDPKAARVRHPRYDKILACCSAGPWRHGRHLPGFSADSQPCIYGNERHFPLAVLDADDRESWTNVVVMGAAYELCQELGPLHAGRRHVAFSRTARQRGVRDGDPPVGSHSTCRQRMWRRAKQTSPPHSSHRASQDASRAGSAGWRNG